MSKSKQSAATKPSSSYKIGDRTVANTYWDGNNYTTQYNPTDSETSAMNTLQSAIPQAYKDATDSNGLASYKQNWINNQTNQLNETANEQLTNLKDKLITGGQVGSSTGWNKIGKFTDSYTDALSDIVSNADTNALNYQQNLLNYANNLQSSMNNYYNLASSMAQNSASNQQAAANQNLQYTAFNNAVNAANSGSNGWNSLAKLGGTIGGAALGSYFGNPQLGAAAGSNLASMTGG